MIKRLWLGLVRPVIEVSLILVGFAVVSVEPLIGVGILVTYVAYTLDFLRLLNRLPNSLQAILLYLTNNGSESSMAVFSVFMSVFCLLLTYPYAHKYSRGVLFFSLKTLLFLFCISVAYTSAASLGIASIVAQWIILVWFGIACVTLKKKPSTVVESTLQATLPKDYTCALCHRKSVSNPCRSCNRRELQRVRAQNLRAKQAGVPASLTLMEWLTTLKSFDYKCAYCQSADFTLLEHYIPIPHAGTTAENCVPGCRSCNAKKSNKHPEK